MRRLIVMAGVAAFVAVGSLVYAQEPAGPGRIEITGFPTGGMFFTDSSSKEEPYFSTYALGASFTYNFNRTFSLEGEFGNAVGLHQELTFSDRVLTDQRSPSMYSYTGNVVFNPVGNNHAWVPYATAGLGGITMHDHKDTAALGVTENTTYLAGNVGGGLKWFARRYFGLRADYRLVGVNDKSTAPEFFGHREMRYAHRVYGGLILTY